MTRVLVVDDRHENIYYLRALLEAHGYEVAAAADGAEALAEARRHPPGLVITDLLMPVMDGYALLRAWRADPDLRHIPLVVYTATYTTPEDEALALTLGAAAFITKPAEPAALMARLRAVPARIAPPTEEGPALETAELKEYNKALIRKLEAKVQQADAALLALQRESAERERLARLHHATLDALPAQVAVLDTDGAILDVNRAWRTFRPETGLGHAGRAAGDRYPDTCRRSATDPPELGERAADGIAAVLAGTRTEFTLEHACHDGQRQRWFRLVVAPLGDAAGGAVVLHIDITEQHHAVEALQSSEERFRELAENVQEVFWMTDATKSTMLYISPAYEAIWGRPCASLYESALTWMEAIHPDDRERVSEAAQRQAESFDSKGGAYNQTYRIVRPDGSVRWIRDRAFPVRDAAGEVRRIVGTAVDVTESRQMEEQFRQAQKMESVGRLAGGIAHDFNNLLTVINGLAEMLLANTPPGDPLRDDLEGIRLAGDRGAKLTKQLLALSRQQVLQPEIVNLGSVVQAMRGILERLLGEDVDLRVTTPPALGYVRADPSQIEQVILNLAVNARDAMPDGGSLLIETREVRLDDEYAASHPTVEPGPHVMLAVSDTGTGMDEPTRQRIFEPFFTTKEVGRGTGLGLSTVYGIVKQSGGSVWVYSEPGHGTTFKVYFPRVDGVPAAVAGSARQGEDRGTETILLVEDQPALRLLAKRVLEAAGYTVIDSANGQDAIAASDAFEGPIHLLLTDVVMPGMNGRAVAAEITARRAQTRVLFTSGYTDDAILRHGVLDDASRFISKPYTPTELRRKVRQAIDGG